MFTKYLTLWNLTLDGEPIHTHCADLLPVRQDGTPAMLKIAREEEERFGGLLMVWWNGDGAAPVLAHDADALLLLRAEGTRSLSQMARSGAAGDEEATRILCRAAARLHAPRKQTLPELMPLIQWFRDLFPAAETYGGIFRKSAETAEYLLSAPQEVTVLHGDIHHENVLDFGGKGGWLAIDPKRLLGERGFDYANIFGNPDRETAATPGRFARRVAIVAEASGIERRRLLQWILAWNGLSAAWWLGDSISPDLDLILAEWAAAELSR